MDSALRNVYGPSHMKRRPIHFDILYIFFFATPTNGSSANNICDLISVRRESPSEKAGGHKQVIESTFM